MRRDLKLKFSDCNSTLVSLPLDSDFVAVRCLIIQICSITIVYRG